MHRNFSSTAFASLILLLPFFGCATGSTDEEGVGGSSSGGANANVGGTLSEGSGSAASIVGGASGEMLGGSGNAGGTRSGGASTGGNATGSSGGGGNESAGGNLHSMADGGSNAMGGSGGAAMEDDLKTFVYVGSGDWSDPAGGLVSVYEMDRVTQKLGLISEHEAGGLASFLAIDQERRRLYVADESNGGVISYSIDAETGSLSSLGSTPSENAPVYLSVSPDGTSLLAANYNEGNVDVYPIGGDGKAQPSSQTESTGSQAHCIVIDATDRVLVANKGESTIRQFTFSAGALTAAGPGPTSLDSVRHLFNAADGRVYAVSESADLLTVFDLSQNGELVLAWQGPRLPEGGNGGADTGGDVQVTPSGKFLYATNRGESNTVVAYDLQGATPQLIGHVASEGTTPRNLAVDPLEEFVIVANHGATTSLVTFAVAADGSLGLSEALSVDFAPYFVGVVRF